jgi:hypothetical protein
MASFPRTDPEIAALALTLLQGLEQAPDEFPNPPVAPSELQAVLLRSTRPRQPSSRPRRWCVRSRW